MTLATYLRIMGGAAALLGGCDGCHRSGIGQGFIDPPSANGPVILHGDESCKPPCCVSDFDTGVASELPPECWEDAGESDAGRQPEEPQRAL